MRPRSAELPSSAPSERLLTFPLGKPLESVQREIEAAVGQAAEDDPHMRANPARVEWLLGTPGVDIDLDEPPGDKSSHLNHGGLDPESP